MENRIIVWEGDINGKIDERRSDGRIRSTRRRGHMRVTVGERSGHLVEECTPDAVGNPRWTPSQDEQQVVDLCIETAFREMAREVQTANSTTALPRFRKPTRMLSFGGLLRGSRNVAALTGILIAGYYAIEVWYALFPAVEGAGTVLKPN